MAILLDTATGATLVLKPYYVFGRSAEHADCVLSAPNVSLLHASVGWRDQQWTLTDLSRNGSFINGRLLVKDCPTRLHLGDEVRFASMSSPSWRLIDESAPADLLVPLSADLPALILEPVQNLPDDVAPQLCIYRAANGQWMKETHEGATPLCHGDIVCLGAKAWRLSCSQEQPGTVVPVDTVTCMRFQLSPGEEHVRLSLRRGLSALDLGERTHHYLLMLLARQRLSDLMRDDDPHSQGWMDFDCLVQMLGMDKAHLNIQIFRLRKQFEDAVAKGLICQAFIERRKGRVRLGDVAIEIWAGAQLEGAWTPGLNAGGASPLPRVS